MQKDFEQQVELAMQGIGEATLKTIVEKEIFHYHILGLLQKEGFLQEIVFMGGTSLRLCYGSNRFSEDLDFAAGKDFNQNTFQDMAFRLEEYIKQVFDFPVRVKTPKEMQEEAFNSVKVSKWQVVINTRPEQPDLPSQRIKIEMANVPSYDNHLMPIQVNYASVNTDPIMVKVESKDEILADKLVSLPMSPYIRYRDIWDLTWLKTQQAVFNPDLLKSKLADYGFSYENYLKQVQQRQQDLEGLVKNGKFATEMTRFLKQDSVEKLRNIDYQNFFVRTLTDLMTSAKQTVENTMVQKPNSNEFSL